MGEGLREEERERHWLPPACAHPGMGSELATQVCTLTGESNPQHFGVRADSLTTEPASLARAKPLLFIRRKGPQGTHLQANGSLTKFCAA